MKHLALVTVAILFAASISAQSLSVNCLRSSFIGGYNITCHGATDGTINSIVTGGQPPYNYNWSNGAISQNLNSLPAGEYILTVTDSLNTSVVDTVELIEPDELTVGLWTWEDGYGDFFGFIGIYFDGGTTSSLDILWSTGENYFYLNDATLGLHWITITDANGCVASDTISMNPMPNGVKITTISQHNISCHGGNDGSIDLTVSDGLEPYTYQWSNGNFTQNIDTLPAGTYTVIVTDWYQTKDTAHITLTQPVANWIQFSTSTYPNGYNTSCATCTDASITASDTGGVSPRTYLWSDGKTGAVNNSLGKGIYSVTVTDGNGCTATQSIELTAEMEAWKIKGNAGIDTTTQFMGTTDNKDLILKTNNSEQLRLKADGDINFPKLAGTDYDVAMFDPKGNLLRVDPGGNPVGPTPNPNPISCFPWNTCGNNLQSTSYLGSHNNVDVVFKTFGQTRMIITNNGVVGIGINPHTASGSNTYKLLVGGKFGANEVWVSLGTQWPDYVLEEDYIPKSLQEIKNYFRINKHLPDMPSASEVKAMGEINLGDIQVLSVKEIEEIYLHLIKMDERINELEKQNSELRKLVSNKK